MKTRAEVDAEIARENHAIKPYYADEWITIYHGDARDILPSLPRVDATVTDPPYVFGIASTFQETKAGGWGDLMNASVWYASWLTEVQRLTRRAAWVFNSWRSFPVLARSAYDARWPIESLMVWDKEWIGPGGSRGLRPSYELVALFLGETYGLPGRGTPDIWRTQWAGAKEFHPAEKPVSLLRRILEVTASPNADHPTVLDPFCGSGSTLVAAKESGWRAIGVEIEERYCEVAAKRCAQEVFSV